MSKKIISVIIILIVLGLIYYFLPDSTDNSNLNVTVRKFDIKEREFSIKNSNIVINFNANAVFNKFSKKYMELTLYLSNVDNILSESFNEDCFVGYYEVITGNDTAFIVADRMEILSNLKIKKKNAISMILDYSVSMHNNSGYNSTAALPITYLEKAANKFIYSKNSYDLVEIIKFGSTIDLVCSFTDNNKKLGSALYQRSYERVGTALFSSIANGINHLNGINNTYMKSLVAFTDGGDHDSQITYDELVDLAKRCKIPIFTVGLKSEDFDENILYILSKSTGGFYYSTPSPEEIEKLYYAIDNNIRNSYLLKFYWNAIKIPLSYDFLNFVCRIIDMNTVVAEYRLDNINFNN
ncbi:VWA domain-containing protein [Bacteroidetes/Chlorobi group bacterium ChocPot_Mid]|nr:MAG: VWA domain-containing protein [Bacteroidetes/Chlorobi group bacterium ChocPot_Mid]